MAWNLRQFRKRGDFPIETRELRNTLMFFCEVDGSRGRGKETSSEKSLNVWSFVGCLSWFCHEFSCLKHTNLFKSTRTMKSWRFSAPPGSLLCLEGQGLEQSKWSKDITKTLGKHISVEGKVTITSTQQSTYTKLSKSLLYQACL